LVGYGLDDDGTKRGWPLLFAKPKCEGVPLGEADKIFNEGAEGVAVHRAIRQAVVESLQGPIS
jgi:hypothetical protein